MGRDDRSLYAARRPALLREAAGRLWDLIVIGGGITGAGVAREATLAGLTVLILEQADFAAGTSSRSTKIFHGGLRYLEHGELGLVRTGGRERERMTRLGPHLVRRVPMMLPVYHDSPYGLTTMSGAVWLYDRLAGVSRGDRRRVLDVAAVHALAPALRQEGLRGAVRYHEMVTDDARTTLTVLRAATAKGAVAVNYARVTNLLLDHGRVAGVEVLDGEEPAARPYVIHGRQVVNAGGPWAETVLLMERADRAGEPRLLHSRGIHVVVPRVRVPVKEAWSLPTPDHRLAFVIPRADAVYIGTTDAVYDGPLDEPPVPPDEVDYLLSVTNAYFPSARLREEDVVGRWSGVRPLIRQPGRQSQDVSRRDEVWVSSAGLVTIAGGKLTAWRQMAEEVIHVLYREAGREGRRFPVDEPACRAASRNTPLPGSPEAPESGWEASLTEQLVAQFGMEREVARLLAERYGAEASTVLALAAEALPAEKMYASSVPGIPLLVGEWPYLLTREMSVHLSDVVVRRTGLGWFGGPAARSALPELGAAMAEWMQWDAARTVREVAETARAAYWLP